jgi:hypothetical protein
MIKEIDRIYAYRIMQMLLKPFNEQQAFSLGIIDENGNEKRQPSDSEEVHYTKLHKMAFQVKQIINDLPSGKQRLRKIAVAMALLKPLAIPSMYKEDVQESYLKLLDVVLESDIGLPEEECMLESTQIDFVVDVVTEGNLFSVKTSSGEFTIGAGTLEEAKEKVKKCLGVSEEMVTTAAIDASTPRIKKHDPE